MYSTKSKFKTILFRQRKSEDLIYRMMATVDSTVLYNLSSIKENKLGYLTHKKEVNIETETATHSSILSWEIPWTKESGGLQFMGSQRFGHELATEQKYMRWGVLINSMGGSFYSVYHIILLYTINILQFYLPVVLQFSSVTQSCLTLCNPMNCSMPGFLAHHQFPEHTQTHDHRLGDAIQPSHPLSSPFPSAFNRFQHQGPFQQVSSSHQVAKVLEFQLQHESFQWIFQDWFPLGWTGWISLWSKGPSRVFSNTTIQKDQFFSIQVSL